jgi:short-subunit dehydrogenase involved in D-alanine esterification of teichoic acids
MFTLTGRTALVTGASGGIGSAIAKALSEAGAKVVLSGTREGVLNEVAATLPGESAVVTCNLSDPDAVDGLAAKAEEVIGPLDILVANAGITRDKLLMQMKDDDWNDVININLGSYYRLTKSVVRGMMKRRHGRIIGITSVVGVTGNPGQTNYCASKAGHDRLHQITGSGSRQPRHYGQRDRTWLHRIADDGCAAGSAEEFASRENSGRPAGAGWRYCCSCGVSGFGRSRLRYGADAARKWRYGHDLIGTVHSYTRAWRLG